MPIMRVVGKGMLRLHAAIPLQQMVMGVIIFVSALYGSLPDSLALVF